MRVKRLKVEFVLIIVSLLVVAWLQMPRLSDEFQVDEDFRTFYWMNKFEDPELFPTYTRGYTEIHFPLGTMPVTYISLGYSLIFYAASFFVSPILFSKLLAFILMPITILYLFKFGSVVGGKYAGVALALGFLFFNLASSSSISVISGLQRSFAATLIIMLVYYLHCQHYKWAAMVLLLSALLYVPIFALGIVVWGIYVVINNWPTHKSLLTDSSLIFLLVAFCLGVLILLPGLLDRWGSSAVQTSAEVVGQTSVNSVESAYRYFWNKPRYQFGGSAPLFIVFPIVGRGGLVDLGEDLINLLILILLGGLILLVRGRKALDLPLVIWCTLGGTWILFALSWLAIWLTGSNLFYWPSRYTRIGLFLFLIMFVCKNLPDFLKEAPLLIRRNPRRLIWLVVGVELVIVGLVIGYPSEWATVRGFNMKWLLILAGGLCGFLGFLIYRMPQRSISNQVVRKTRPSFAFRGLIGVSGLIFLLGWGIYTPILTEVSYLNPPPPERSLFQFLQTLPKDTLLAGTPCALDSVPLFAKRTALFSCEFEKAAAVIPEALRAYYSDDPEVIAGFCHAYQIDYLVVDSQAYTDDYVRQGQMFFKPYNQELLADIGDRDQFVLAEVPDEEKSFQAGDYFVIPCEVFGTSD